MLQRPHPHHRGPLELLLAQTINQRPFYSNYTQGGTALSCPHLAAHTLLFIPPPTIQFASLTLFFFIPTSPTINTPPPPNFCFLPLSVVLQLPSVLNQQSQATIAVYQRCTVICKCMNMLQIIGKGERWTDGVRGGERDRSMQGTVCE